MENIRKTAVHADGEGGIVIQTRQDVSDIIEQNKKEYNSYDERARWSDQLFGNKVASIPMTVIDDLMTIVNAETLANIKAVYSESNAFYLI